MASSSSSTSKRFDVFLSFRGEDTRRYFLSHLEKEFESKGINVFKDDRNLQSGDRISDELTRAIEDSKFAVVVLSKNYASSGWCLAELEKIMECEEKGMLTVIPIFYEVDPSDVRRRKRTFAEAFEKHDARESEEKVQKWKDSLTKVANLSGKHSKESSTDAALVSKIGEDISKRLFSMVPRDYGDKVGMDAHFETLAPLLKMESGDEVRMIGIWGMGGIGKTTIAKCLYRKYKCRFQFHCFMEDIKKNYKDKGKKMLRRQLLSKILGDEKLLSQTREIDSHAIKSRLYDRRVLVILDDVDDLKQLKALAKCTNWFGLGSRIIITTRDKALFIAHGVKLVHKVKCLRYDAALELFNRSVFGDASIENQVSDDFKKLSDCAMKLVKGHPLGIKVLGNALCGRKMDYWEDVLHRLSGDLRMTVMKCLKVSYDGLGDQDKNVLLTVACLFVGEHESHLLPLLDGEEREVRISFTTLAEKALIDISEYGRVTMHDLIQEMAKDIVCQQSNNEPERQKFLWNFEEIYDVLEDGLNADAIQGISLDMSKLEDFPVCTKSFGNMPNLKFLVIRNTSRYRGDFLELRAAINHLPRKLKLLDWKHCPLTALPLIFEAKCLVDLRLPCSDIEKFSERTKLGKLRRLELQSCLHLKQIPKQLGNIVELNLSETEFRELPEIPNLATLEILDLSHCERLLEIPNTIGNLIALKDLKVEWCKELTSIPDTIGNLVALETLNLKFCRMLSEIPNTIGNLIALKDLQVEGCYELTGIPDSIGNLVALETLNLEFCSMLSEIPTSIGNLTALKNLELSYCRKLRGVPDTVGSLSSLKKLGLSACTMLLEIPSTIGNLALVEDLSLRCCQSISRIPDLIGNFISLRRIELNCEMLSEISSSIGNFTTLQSLWVSGCQNLHSIPSTIGSLTSLKKLHLLDCPMLAEIPSTIGDLKALKHLLIQNCEMLGNIPDTMGNLTSLENLCLSRCPKLRETPSTIGDLRALKVLRIENYEMLGNIPDTIGNLTSLEGLHLSGYTMVVEIPSWIGDLRALRHLSIRNCKKLEKFPDTIGNLTALESLILSGCFMLYVYDIPRIIQNLPSLKYLSPPEDLDYVSEIIEKCYSRELLSWGTAPLKEDVIRGDWEIAPGNQVVQALRLSRQVCFPNGVPFRCTRLSIFPDLRELSLRNLNILEIPDDLGNLRALQSLDLRGNGFEILPASIQQLPLLEKLDLSRCRKIQSIPGLPLRLKHLYANDCSSLESITNVYKHLFHELSLANCFKLSLDLQQFIQHMILATPSHKGEIKTLACFSARELPDCFSYQSKEQKLRIPSSQIDSGFKPVGFVAGILVARNGFLDVSDVNIRCWLHGEGYQTRQICFGPQNSSFLGHPSHSDLLVVLSCNFGEEKSFDEISFHLSFKNWFDEIPKINRCGISLCFTKELQQG